MKYGRRPDEDQQIKSLQVNNGWLTNKAIAQCLTEMTALMVAKTSGDDDDDDDDDDDAAEDGIVRWWLWCRQQTRQPLMIIGTYDDADK